MARGFSVRKALVGGYFRDGAEYLYNKYYRDRGARRRVVDTIRQVTYKPTKSAVNRYMRASGYGPVARGLAGAGLTFLNSVGASYTPLLDDLRTVAVLVGFVLPK